MPCYDSSPFLVSNNYKHEWDVAIRKCNKLTDMLCRLLTLIDENYIEEIRTKNYVHEDIKQWWEEHKKLDEERN